MTNPVEFCPIGTRMQRRARTTKRPDILIIGLMYGVSSTHLGLPVASFFQCTVQCRAYTDV